MPRYRDMFREMIKVHEKEFGEFSEVHDKYMGDRKRWQKDFNKKGLVVMEIIHEWENRLCGKTERGSNAVFSTNLADKFRAEIKAFFPMIDFVGVTIS